MLQTFSTTWQDPSLPYLDIVTDSRAMAYRFAQNLRMTLLQQKWQVENCALERLQYHWSKCHHCRLLYRVNLRDASGQKFDQWFWGELWSNDRVQRKFEEAQHSPFLQNGIWQPVQLWPELNMIIWSFPNDPEMPGLLKATDLAFVQSQVNANLAAWGLRGDWRCVPHTLKRVKYMPGKRCVLRYHLRLVDSRGQSRDLSFYSKTYHDSASTFHYQVLQKVYDHLHNRINIPRPLVYLKEACTFWQEPWEGRPLVEMLDNLEWNELFPRLATVLATFHQSQCQDLPEAGNWDEVLDSAQEDTLKLGWFFPQYRSRLNAALAALLAAKANLTKQEVPVVPIHGAIRLEQLVARHDEVALVDFDAAGLGDPLYDVAEFLASLQYMEFSYGFPHRFARAAELFMASYQQQVPWVVNPQRMAWYTVAFLLSKMLGSLKHLDRGVLQRFEAVLEIIESRLKFLR